MGACSAQNRISAAPPMAVNTGAPRIVARRSTPSAGSLRLAGSTGRKAASSMITAPSRRVRPRPYQLFAACQARRRAIRPKPAGSTSSTTHIGTPYASWPPPVFSVSKNRMLARQRKALMAAAVAWLKMWATVLTLPFSSPVMAENESSRLSRAAIAPPTMPMISVRCWTKAAEPEIPVWNRRRIVSSSGSSMRATSGSTSNRSSDLRVAPRQPAASVSSNTAAIPPKGVPVISRLPRRDTPSADAALHQKLRPTRCRREFPDRLSPLRVATPSQFPA